MPASGERPTSRLHQLRLVQKHQTSGSRGQVTCIAGIRTVCGGLALPVLAAVFSGEVVPDPEHFDGMAEAAVLFVSVGGDFYRNGGCDGALQRGLLTG